MNATTSRYEAPALWSWLLPAIYCTHILEEYAFGWVNWAQGQGLAFEWSDFFLTNAAVIVLGLCTAAMAPRSPVAAMSYAALMLINGLVFHLLPSVAGARPNPGFITAVLLFVPLGGWSLREWWRAGATRRDFALAFAFAAAVQCFPLVLLVLRARMGWAAAD